MSLGPDAITLEDLIEQYGFTAVLDEMGDLAALRIDEWRATYPNPSEPIAAIIGDLERTMDAIEVAARDVRG